MKGKSSPKPPVAAIKPRRFTVHGDTRVDEYFWLQDSKNRAVTDYIALENTYADKVMSDTAKLQKRLYREMRSRVIENDESVPTKDGPYYYYRRVSKGKERAIHCRKFGKNGKEEVILDENKLAKGKKFFSLGTLEVHPNHTLLAYSIDTTGNEDYFLYIKDLRSGKLLKERIPSVGDVAWAEDGQHFFYTKEKHPFPPRSVYLHKLGTDVEKDIHVYTDPDIQWYVSLSKSRSREYIFINASSFDTTEVRFIPSRSPHEEPKLISKRKKSVKYFVNHHDGHFYIMTNERAVNYKILRTTVINARRSSWETWMAHDIKRPIVGFLAFEDFFVLNVRVNGIEEILIIDPVTKKETCVELPDEGHSIVVSSDTEYTSGLVRFSYQSFITPRTIYDYDARKNKLIERKQDKVPRWDENKYVTKREWVKSGAVRVPVIVVHRKDLKLNGKNPTLLEAYGSYGISSDPYFSSSKLSLLERGWVIALGNPRGGGELGWHWHQSAKLLTKHRTYDDFIAIAQHLIKKEYTSPERLSIAGGSAGGMMIGAVLNMRPDLFNSAIAYVPESDLVTTSLDPSLGGTRLHYDETGDPRKKDHYLYLKKWSPYEGVKKMQYPSLLVRASMHDIRTPYWGAAKWVARLRARKTDAHDLFLKIEMSAGHAGKTGRYEWIKERAFDFAYLIRSIQKSGS